MPIKDRDRPPFRADHVGSLLRPKRLLDAREHYAKGAIDASVLVNVSDRDGTGDEAAALREIENECIAEAVKLQQDVGLKGITDGEFRRSFFHVDFLQRIEGVDFSGGITASFRSATGTIDFAPPKLSVTGKVRRAREINVEDFKFLNSRVSRTAKICIPSPTMAHFRGGRGAIDEIVYPDMDEFFADLARVYREEIADLAANGCTYLQLDDTNLAYLCDPKLREGARAIGEDPDELPHLYARLINACIDDRPANMSVSIHLCRGNFKSAWVAEGGYEPVAEALFNEINVDGYFLEYDDPRSGDFAPLRFVPDDKIIVLGLLTTKDAALEPKDDIKRRIDEAAVHVPLERLCLSPQCGFSSTVHGNEITLDDQIAKLGHVVEIAEDVWGTA
ncbi:MAG: 5-methyltetrahydropteroyltriglutamate--homocysteine S-methyltransferase [Alphaproteobacteria bacterium]